ncbi:hypothetical protein [Candidatus Binatus sp.]|uniref:hypothetical protein n=1 Tax=Candidatus Binatus sp. TaxID=2811406 RepID=UPI002FD95AAE
MLSKKAQELLGLLTGKKAVTKSPGNREQLWMSQPVENVQLKEGTVAFIKSVLPAKTMAGALAQKGAQMRVAKVGGSADLDRGFATLSKRAPHVAITEAEMQGATPRVAPIGKPRSEPGLSDAADLRALEDATTTEALTPAEATVRFLAAMKIIRENMGRRITAEE